MTQTFDQSVCMSAFNSSWGPYLWPWRICPLFSSVTHCIINSFAVVLTDINCGDFGREIMFISNMMRLQHWIRAWHTILWMKDILPNGLLLLEGKDGREYYEHAKKCAPCHLSIEGTIHPKVTVVLKNLLYFVCGEKKWATSMILFDQCQRAWHMACLKPPLTSLPLRQWSCIRCRESSVLGVSTSRSQWSCVIIIVSCLPKWTMRIYDLETWSNERQWN